MSLPNDLSRSPVPFEQESTLVAASGEETALLPRSNAMECPMSLPNDLSRSLVPFEQESTLVAVVELSQASWLIAGVVPGVERQPLKKMAPDEDALLRLLHRWRDEAIRNGHPITRITVALEAGRDGFWLARWLTKHGIEAHVIHSSSVAVSR